MPITGIVQSEVQEIYHYNIASRRCFEKAGFRAVAETERGMTMRLTL